MKILDALDIDGGQAVQPQIARWIVGNKQYVIETEADWNDSRLPKIVKAVNAIEPEEVPNVEVQ